MKVTKLLAFASICAMILYASVSAAAVITDGFDNPSSTAQYWHPWNTDSNQTVAQTNSQVEITIGKDSNGDVFGAGMNSNFSLKGDFDIMVKYQLLNWPATNGVRMAIRYNAGPNGYGQITRQSCGADEGPITKEIYLTNFVDTAYMDV